MSNSSSCRLQRLLACRLIACGIQDPLRDPLGPTFCVATPTTGEQVASLYLQDGGDRNISGIERHFQEYIASNGFKAAKSRLPIAVGTLAVKRERQTETRGEREGQRCHRKPSPRLIGRGGRRQSLSPYIALGPSLDCPDCPLLMLS